MKHLVLSVFILFTITASAQAPSVKRLATLVKTHDFNLVRSYADSLGYNQYNTSDEIGNMYEYNLQTFSKDSSSYLTYSSGHHYAMNQGPLMVSLSYGTSSKTEFDTLIAEIKALGAEEKQIKDGDPYYHLYNYTGINISTYLNSRSNGPKYTISFNANFW